MGAQFKFIHCADLHLGSRFRGVARDDRGRAAEMTASVFASFSRIVDVAIDERADAMVISGDAFDEETITPRTRDFLCRELARADIPVFMVRGNHDPVTQWESEIPFPPNVHVFGTEPEAIDIPGVESAEVIGASFMDWHDSRNLPSMMRGSPDRFTVACVHCDVDNPSSEYDYSPCSRSDFFGKGVDYWALGHIHKRAVLCEDPWVVYPGNIQGRSFKETGEKGAYLVTVRDGRVDGLRFIPTQAIVWHDIRQDITGLDMNSLKEALATRVGKGSVARLTLIGAGQLDRMIRDRPDDVMSILEAYLGCTISSMGVETTESIDPELRRGERDMIGVSADVGFSIRDASVQDIIDIICSNPILRKNRPFFESMPEEDLRAIVTDATRSVVNMLGASR